MARYQQLFSDAQRQQALADSLAQRAIQPRAQQQQGRIASAYSIGEGLSQLGEALIARRSGKKAASMTAQAEEVKRQEQAAALAGLTGKQDMSQGPPEPANPYASAQGALDAGIDPSVVGSYLKQQQPQAGQDPAKVDEYRFAQQNGYKGTFEEYLNQFYGREQNAPSAWIEWEKFSKLTPEEQRNYIEMKRSIPIETINQVPTRVLPGGAQQPLSTLPSEANAAATINDAKAEGSETGGARGTAIANLPQVQSTTRAALETVDKMLQHPGMGTATGLSGTLDPRNYIPGTDARDFAALKNQAQGQVFLDAFQALKGGGTVTEVEGLKAEQAKARMDTAQSDEEFRAALNDYANALRRGLQLAEQRAGMVTGGRFGGEVPTIQVPNAAPPDDPLGLRR